jgi:hypothetical protein
MSYNHGPPGFKIGQRVMTKLDGRGRLLDGRRDVNIGWTWLVELEDQLNEHGPTIWLVEAAFTRCSVVEQLADVLAEPTRPVVGEDEGGPNAHTE